MGDPVKELQQEKNNNINPINTDPLQTSQNNINAPVNLNTQAGHIDQQIHMDQTNEVNEDEAPAPVLPRHPREFPDIPTTNRAARTQHDKTDAAAKLFSLAVHNNFTVFIFLYFC